MEGMMVDSLVSAAVPGDFSRPLSPSFAANNQGSRRFNIQPAASMTREILNDTL